MKIEVSIGEVVDKWTIVSIKVLKIEDKDKLANVNKERIYLGETIPPEILYDPLVDQLLSVNLQLWQVEDDLRICEKEKDFSLRFTELARSVYKLNDERARIKKEINMKHGSEFVEEKSYQPY
jgi:hypothetical protein